MRDPKRIKPFLKYIEREWLKSPDQRFGQLLINLGILPDVGNIWNSEIVDYPLPYEVLREIVSWRSYKYTRKGVILKRHILKDLSDTHLQNILATQDHITGNYRKLLKEEIKYRKANNVSIV